MSAGARVSVSGCIRVSPAVYGRFFPISSREDLPGSVATGGFPDPLERLCLGAVDAFRVHLQQDRNAMAGQARIALLNSALILSLGRQPGIPIGQIERRRRAAGARSLPLITLPWGPFGAPRSEPQKTMALSRPASPACSSS